MPVVVSKGFGTDDAGGTSFTGLGISPGVNTLDITLSRTAILTGPAADPSQWIITPLDSSRTVTVLSVSLSTSTNIHITTTPHTNGGSYSIQVPGSGLTDSFYNVYQGPFTFNYTAQSVVPEAIMARSIDARLVEIIFNEPVTDSALNPANYTISPTLAVVSVVKVTDNIYRLTTARQVTGTSYTVTASNIFDSSGNSD